MGTERRRQLLLGAVVIVLAFVLYRAWTQTSAVPGPASNQRGAQGPRRIAPGREMPSSSSAADVHLQALEAERPEPVGAERNLFRFKPKAPPPPAAARGAAPVPAPAAPPTGPPPPAPLPPINLKFIGVMDQGEGKPKIAILTDGVGPPMYGVEGQTVAGRYRILRIGAESIEMAYLDGRGRQTIRLSGS